MNHDFIKYLDLYRFLEQITSRFKKDNNKKDFRRLWNFYCLL